MTKKNHLAKYITLIFLFFLKTHLLVAQTNHKADTIPKETLSTAEIIAKKRNVVYKLDKKVIDAAGYSSSTGGTAIDILEHTPSIRIDAQGELTFRGSNGFKVYIDGQPSTLNGSAALEQIPASQIENIEVMTTPSAQYSPDGTVGIINVVLKKRGLEGWNGMVNASISSVESRNFDLLMTHKKGPLAWNVSANATKIFRKSDFDQIKKITIKDTLTTTQSTGPRIGYIDNYSGRTGLEYSWTKTKIFADIEGGYRGTNRGGELNYIDVYQHIPTLNKREASYKGTDFVDLHEWFTKASAGFQHQFNQDGHKIQASYFIMYGGNALEYFQTDLYSLSGKQIQGHKAWEDEYRWTSQAKVDYTLPLSLNQNNWYADQTKLQLGYLLDSYMEDGDYKIKIFDPKTTQFVDRNELGATYLFKRDVHSLYSMISNGGAAKLRYQLGVRSEYTYQKLGGSTAWANHVETRMEFFPSAHLAYQISPKSTSNLAYSRRTTRPELFFMEPYIVYVDYYTAQTGNPYIRPEYTNSFEWGYQHNLGKNNITSSLFHRSRKDKIERIRTPYHTGITLDSIANVGDDFATGLEMTSLIYLKPFWTIDVNASLYYYTIKNEYIVGNEESWNRQLNISNSFDLSKNTRLQVDGNYVGPSVNTQGQTDEFYYINVSLRQHFFNRKLSLSLAARDILSTARYQRSQTTTDLYSYTTIKPRSPLITLGISYVFNNFARKTQGPDRAQDLFEGTNR